MKQIIERLDYLESVLANVFQEVVQIRAFINSISPEEPTEQAEEEAPSGTAQELRTAVEEGQIAGFIGTMKDFK
jgi:uncharacterized membrane protein